MVIEKDILQTQLAHQLDRHISVFSNRINLNSTSEGIPKYLHWFEWEKKNLHLYDVVNYSHHLIKLIISFKIPVFSRSIMTPQGKIFLMGGEDGEGAKKSVYSIDINQIESVRTLTLTSNMPSKKIDFSLAYIDNFIYVICGKD